MCVCNVASLAGLNFFHAEPCRPIIVMHGNPGNVTVCGGPGFISTSGFSSVLPYKTTPLPIVSKMFLAFFSARLFWRFLAISYQNFMRLRLSIVITYVRYRQTDADQGFFFE